MAGRAAHEAQRQLQGEIAFLQKQVADSGTQLGQLQAQLQQLNTVHEELKGSSASYQQELEGTSHWML